jgi:hypothetical protein
MTPGYVFGEMTMEEVQTCIDHIVRWELQPKSEEHYRQMARGLEEWLAPGGQQDLSWLEPPLGKVIRKHGN